MEAMELMARREALGLDQAGLAAVMRWDKLALADCEAGTRETPAMVDAKLDELELARDTIAGILEDALPGDLPTYSSDGAFWARWPRFRGVPASVHRVATADALRSAKWAGIQARIVPASPTVAGQGTSTA